MNSTDAQSFSRCRPAELRDICASLHGRWLLHRRESHGRRSPFLTSVATVAVVQADRTGVRPDFRTLLGATSIKQVLALAEALSRGDRTGLTGPDLEGPDRTCDDRTTVTGPDPKGPDRTGPDMLCDASTWEDCNDAATPQPLAERSAPVSEIVSGFHPFGR